MEKKRLRNAFRFIQFYAFYITLSIEFWSLLSSFSLSVFHAQNRNARIDEIFTAEQPKSNLHKSNFSAKKDSKG